MNQGHFRTGMLILKHTKFNEIKENKNAEETLSKRERKLKMKRYFSIGQFLLKLLFPALWTIINIEETGKFLFYSNFNISYYMYISIATTSPLCCSSSPLIKPTKSIWISLYQK